MELMVNGKQQDQPDGLSVTQLLERLQVVPERVVVEVNLDILRRAQFPLVTLKPGDQVEIVQMIGSG